MILSLVAKYFSLKVVLDDFQHHCYLILCKKQLGPMFHYFLLPRCFSCIDLDVSGLVLSFQRDDLQHHCYYVFGRELQYNILVRFDIYLISYDIHLVSMIYIQ